MALRLVLWFFFSSLTILLLWLTEAPAVEATPLAKPGCQDRCGDVSIPFPFGIGDRCSKRKQFEITCDRSSSHPTPFLSLSTGRFQVLNISMNGELRINVPTFSSPNETEVHGRISLEGSPFFFSQSGNVFVAVGCNNRAFVHNHHDNSTVGCISTCSGRDVKKKGCCGISCCQTPIPWSLQTVDVTITSAGICNEILGCKSAFVVDQQWFVVNLPNPYDVRNMTEVPVVLDWWSDCGPNSYPISLSSLRNTCICKYPFEGNPYLPHGCQGCKVGHRCEKGKGYLVKAISLGVGLGFGLLLMFIFSFWLYKALKRREIKKVKKNFFKRNGGLLLQQQMSSQDCAPEKINVFTAEELEKATDNYNKNRILGQGGQGTVYKGMLSDGRIVAIKKSKKVDDDQSEQFINEFVILSQINHRNVVRLLGCCLETEVPMLVYEFISGGNLFNYIHDRDDGLSFSWDNRLRIAIEVAGALAYLHSAASVPIYHRDIKSSNILLDDKLRAKLSDFGTSRSIVTDQTHLTTMVKGTFGYLDPEYFRSSHYTDKSDVYSFGVVLIELLTGEKAVSSTRPLEEKNLAVYFMSSLEENNLFEVLDNEVVKDSAKEELCMVANLAKKCLNLNGKKRPTMREVVVELEGLRLRKQNSLVQQDDREVGYFPNESSSLWDTYSTSSENRDLDQYSITWPRNNAFATI
ncbi:PREDICTED: wall-associated receptor kinase-like 8 [Nelumbo nucifera]|uniref:Wall-associated receptor kinase-like 8 n=2 Tax=Nelumbo nucifera TaxID=4432 RepID=A0A1U8B2B9_NELNU|nr:PREDICTED: wall-associated receptor kinase-like 8 [Nelumbo nucifera]DAD29641.1 TPA_asm: hypothetical protein HUJ06_031109 [Nelumbo nucifera]